MTTTAIFGGSFNPPHIGHTLAVTYALAQHADHVIVVPAFKHAFNKDLAPYYHRRRMVNASMGWLPNVIVSDIAQEIWERTGRTYTLDIVQNLQVQYPQTNLRLLIGADILLEKDKWYRFDEIEKLAPPIVIGRSGYPMLTAIDLPEVSSSAIRERFENGLGDDIHTPRMSKWLAPDVLDYIKNNELYGASPSGCSCEGSK